MKSIVVIALSIFSMAAMAQNGPAASPAAKIVQTIGTTEISVEYSRPSLKGREIFGKLVPYGQKWRTGANSATKFTTAKDITVEGKALAAGSYAIFSTPGETTWQVHFFTYTEAYPPTYNDKTPLLTVSVNAAKMNEKVESFMIVFDGLKADGGEMGFIWDSTYVPVQIGAK
jgi:hypothetical protein